MSAADTGVPRTSTDARAIRTRARLKEAYLALARLGEHPKVSTLIRTAGVNRSSFYAHFDDIDDMTLWLVDEALGDLTRSQAELAAKARQATRVTAIAAGGAYLEAVDANRDALRAAILANRARAHARIGRAIERSMLDFLTITPGWDADSIRARTVTTWVSHGWAGAICAWVLGEIPLSRGALLKELVALNPDPARLP